MTNMTLTRVAVGEYLTPAERMDRIRETRAALADLGPVAGWEWNPLSFWTGQGVLGIPGQDEVLPELIRHDRAAVRRSIAREDWKARRKRKHRVSARFRRIVIERAGHRCAYCGVRLTDNRFEVDHIVPISRGGRGNLANLAAACHDCNWSKFDYLIEKWLNDHHARMRESAWKIVREMFPGRAG
jgi:5-methylcytosine-specific restriction endonuclease McrA